MFTHTHTHIHTHTHTHTHTHKSADRHFHNEMLPGHPQGDVAVRIETNALLLQYLLARYNRVHRAGHIIPDPTYSARLLHYRPARRASSDNMESCRPLLSDLELRQHHRVRHHQRSGSSPGSAPRSVLPRAEFSIVFTTADLKCRVQYCH